MAVVPKWLRDWVAQLRPSQHSSGNGAVNIGRAHAPVHVVNLTQHIIVERHEAPLPPRTPRPAGPARREVRWLTDEHKAVLAMMDPLSKVSRIGVLDFMRREFGTSMVKELQLAEVRRVRAYVQQVHVNLARERELL